MFGFFLKDKNGRDIRLLNARLSPRHWIDEIKTNDRACAIPIGNNNRLIDCFWIYIPLRNFSHMETLPLPVKGCKIYAYDRRSSTLSREGSSSCLTWYDTGLTQGFGVPDLIRTTAPFNRLSRLARGCGEPDGVEDLMNNNRSLREIHCVIKVLLHNCNSNEW
jgi:hypothetical protein